MENIKNSGETASASDHLDQLKGVLETSFFSWDFACMRRKCSRVQSDRDCVTNGKYHNIGYA